MITKTHLARFQEVLKASEVDAALVTSEANQTWVSDFDFSDGYVLVTKEKKTASKKAVAKKTAEKTKKTGKTGTKKK